MIWRRCPKKIFQDKTVVELYTASAVANFTDGASSITKLLAKLGINPGHHTIAGTRAVDRKRVLVAERNATGQAKQQR